MICYALQMAGERVSEPFPDDQRHSCQEKYHVFGDEDSIDQDNDILGINFTLI